MKIQWHGHNCFILTSQKGSSVLLDPFSRSVQIPFPYVEPDIIVISHEHPENNAAWRADGKPFIVKSTSQFPCEHEIHVPRTQEAFIFTGTPTFHDEVLGKRRGPNTVFSWMMDKLHICFLGDLGHVLDKQQVSAIGPVDILFIPVGGRGMTIGPKEATIVLDQLNPSYYVIPMAFKNEAVAWDVEPLEAFLTQMRHVEQVASNCYEVTSLPPISKVLVFNSLPKNS